MPTKTGPKKFWNTPRKAAMPDATPASIWRAAQDKAHPFQGQIGNKKFALAHNGVLLNDRLLQRSKNLPKTHIGTDSYIAVQLLEKQNALNFNSLRKVAEQVQGTEGAGAFRKKSHQVGLFSVRVLTSSTLTSSTFELFRQFVISLALF